MLFDEEDCLQILALSLPGTSATQSAECMASTIEEMFTPQRDDQGKEFMIVSPIPQHVGLGWHLNGSEETRYGYHLGDSGGFHTEIRLYPQLDYGITVCGNETNYNTAAVTNMIVTS